MKNQKTRTPVHTSGIVFHNPRKIDQWDTGGLLKREISGIEWSL